MAITTREVYRVGENGGKSYVGYAKFNGDTFMGTFGGNGRTARGKATNDSQVQRIIKAATMKAAKRNRYYRG